MSREFSVAPGVALGAAASMALPENLVVPTPTDVAGSCKQVQSSCRGRASTRHRAGQRMPRPVKRA